MHKFVQKSMMYVGFVLTSENHVGRFFIQIFAPLFVYITFFLLIYLQFFKIVEFFNNKVQLIAIIVSV